MEDLSLTSLGFSVLSIVIIGILSYLYNKRKKIKLDKIIEESNAAIKESELIRKESKKLLEELKIEKERNFKLKVELQSEKDNLANKSCKPKPISKPRVSKYNKPNILYIAYDFNILGNKSFAEVDKIARDMTYGYRSGIVAIKTTSVVFFDAQYKTVFRDIVLINKKGESISLLNLISNPKYYISDIDDLYNFQKAIDENNNLAFTPKHLLPLIRENKINFKKEKEI